MDLLVEAGYRALHLQAGGNLADGQRAHRRRRHSQLVEPRGQLLRRAHVPGVERFWRACSCDLYRQRYEGLYCTGCEQFYTPAELRGGRP